MLFGTPKPIVVLTVSTLWGCAQWPLHANLPAAHTDAIQADTQSIGGFPVEWTELGAEVEPNDQPAAPETLMLGSGWSFHGKLDGIGWDDSVVPRTRSECGEALAFPPGAPGDYSGDVDWFTLLPEEAGILCIDVALSSDEIQFDVGVYVLDNCHEPIAIALDADTLEPVGLSLDGDSATIAVQVDANSARGIALAGYYPDDPGLSVEWRAGLALLPNIDTDMTEVCPSPPEPR